MQTVSAAGQTAQVGAVISSLSWSGPGELDLFGQNIPTKPQFEGPIRPLLQLTHVTIDRQVAQLLRSDNPRKLKLSLSQQLAQGWTRYFVWETLIAAGFAVVALLAVAGVRRQSHLTMLKTVTAGLVAAGLHGTEAASAVLLFRLTTFWLPVPIGWVALNYLERKDAI